MINISKSTKTRHRTSLSTHDPVVTSYVGSGVSMAGNSRVGDRVRNGVGMTEKEGEYDGSLVGEAVGV